MGEVLRVRVMTTRAWVLLLAVGAAMLVAPDGAVGQEVAGDVMIPPPRELATSTPAAGGLGAGVATLGVETMAAYRAAFEDVVAQVRSGAMSERETRAQLGDFTVSLLMKAGVVSFGNGREPAKASGARAVRP